ncbi:gram-negative bacteria-binding protein 3 [Stomoxys calcitrans]|uniref:gram-negative bacteria-binding protein 3 n=1 Tax=Stomoxys calcitrans TaxID=35570 RepID=UPI0027E2B19C|nr:gram-negative bacteria-binding protein 3 [Stomoxys calcitrans]
MPKIVAGAQYLTLFISLSCLSCELLASDYEVPTAKIEVFYPKGFQVSIPHEEGITLFAFHGKLNEEMVGLEAGTWARDIVKHKDGRWTFRDRVTKLALGDTLYYWTYVIYKGLGYREDDGVYVVNEYANTTTPTVKTDDLPVVDDRPLDKGTCTGAVTIVNGAPVRCAKQLVFEENFDGTYLDNTKWTVERRIPQSPNYEFCLYLDDVADVLQISQGMVSIKPKPFQKHFGRKSAKRPLVLGSKCTGAQGSDECSLTPQGLNIIPPIISAQFSTKGKFSFKYGSVEVRAKMPRGMWIFPQLWLDPSNPVYGEKEYRSGQMRMAQSRDNGREQDLLTGLLLNAVEPWHSLKLCVNKSTNAQLSEVFHLYQLLWTPNFIAFSVDNNEYCRFEIPDEEHAFRNLQQNDHYLPNREILQSGSKWAPFDQEFALTVGLGVGGFNDFPDMIWAEEKPWRNIDPKALKNFATAYRDDCLSNCAFQVDNIKIYSV